MKVSLRRKIHIMAFPHETFLNARWSEDQSAATPRQPGGRVGPTPVSASAASAMCSSSSSGQQLATDGGEFADPRRQESEQDEPEREQKMPVDGAQLHAQAHLLYLEASPPHLVGGHPQSHEAAQQVQSVQSREQIKEGVGRVGRQEIARGVQLLPRQKLPDQECNGEQASYQQAVADAFYPSPARRYLRVLQADAAQDQHTRVEPEQLRRGQLRPVRHLHSHEIGADE